MLSIHLDTARVDLCRCTHSNSRTWKICLQHQRSLEHGSAIFRPASTKLNFLCRYHPLWPILKPRILRYRNQIALFLTFNVQTLCISLNRMERTHLPTKKRYPIRSCSEPLDKRVFFNSSVWVSFYWPGHRPHMFLEEGTQQLSMDRNCSVFICEGTDSSTFYRPEHRTPIFLERECRLFSMEHSAEPTYFWRESAVHFLWTTVQSPRISGQEFVCVVEVILNVNVYLRAVACACHVVCHQEWPRV